MKAIQKEQNFYEGKQKKEIVFQDSSQNNQEKCTLGVQDSSYLENRQEISNANIQINTLTNIQQIDQLKNTTPNFHNLPTSSQIVVNVDEKNQVEGNYKKKKKSLSNQIPFNSYHHYFKQYKQPNKRHNFRQYSARRISDYFIFPSKKIDLGVYNLREVVNICVNKKMISNTVLLSFVSGRDILDEEKFVAQLNNQQFQNLGMEKNYFTPFDHRLLTMLLISQFPHEFQFPKNPLMRNSILTVFYSFLYQLSEEKYEEIIEFLNIKYYRDWMPNNLATFAEQVRVKIERRPDINVEQSYPFNMPDRKVRRKQNSKI